MPVDIKKLDNYARWEDIRELIFLAHESNRKAGVDIRNAHLSADELKESLGDNGVTFIALDGEKLVGTCSIAFKELKCWYASGTCAYFTLDAVHPDYKGKGIFTKLEKERLRIVIDSGVGTIFMYVAEKNVLRRKIACKQGFESVEFRYNPYNSHNFIVYCKWFGKRPMAKPLMRMRYCMQFFKVKLKGFLRG